MANHETEYGASKVKLLFNDWRIEKGAQALKPFPQGMGVKEFKGQERGRIWGPLGKEWRYPGVTGACLVFHAPLFSLSVVWSV